MQELRDDEASLRTFADPFSWCDHACERCPLATRCDPFLNAGPGQDAAHERTPGAQKSRLRLEPAQLAAMLDASRRDLVCWVDDFRREHGMRPGRPVRLDAVRLHERARALARRLTCHPSATVREAGLSLERIASRLTFLLRFVMLPLPWRLQIAPTLLLVDHVRRVLRAELCATPDEDPARIEGQRILDDVDRILEPMMAGLDEPRRILDELIAQGEAPSPFCIVPPATASP